MRIYAALVAILLSMRCSAQSRTNYSHTEFQKVRCELPWCKLEHGYVAVEHYKVVGEVMKTNHVAHPALYQSPAPAAQIAHRSNMNPVAVPPMPGAGISEPPQRTTNATLTLLPAQHMAPLPSQAMEFTPFLTPSVGLFNDSGNSWTNVVDPRATIVKMILKDGSVWKAVAWEKQTP